MDLPPPAGSKNDVFRLRSVSGIVIAPARTGSDSNNSRAVMVIDHTNSGIDHTNSGIDHTNSGIDHTNSGIRSGFTLFGFMLIVVVIKFTAPRMEDTPAK